MILVLRLPDVRQGASQLTINRWLVAPGHRVGFGDTVHCEAVGER